MATCCYWGNRDGKYVWVEEEEQEEMRDKRAKEEYEDYCASIEADSEREDDQ